MAITAGPLAHGSVSLPNDAACSATRHSHWGRLLAYLRPHRSRVAQILSLTLVVAGLNAIEPPILKDIFDRLGEGQSSRRVLLAVAVLLGIGAIRECGAAVANWLTWKARLAVHFALSSDAVARLHSLPVGYHRGQPAGATMMRLD